MAYTDPITIAPGDTGHAADWNTYLRDNMRAMSFGRRSVPPMQRGTTDMELWTWLGVVMYSETGTSSTTQTANTMRGHTCFIPPGATIDRLSFEVTTAVAGNARVGIYAMKSDTNIYPGALLVDGGEFSTGTTGHKIATVSAVANDGWYWFVYHGSAAAIIRTPARSNYMFLGTAIGATPGTTGQGHGLDVSRTYGALPATFPAGAALITTSSIAGVQIRLA